MKVFVPIERINYEGSWPSDNDPAFTDMEEAVKYAKEKFKYADGYEIFTFIIEEDH
jgi:hypothetical protein